MSRRRVKQPSERKATNWSANVGDHGHVVHASERADRGNAVVFRFRDPSRLGADKRVRITSDLTVRDASGQIRPHLVRGVMAEAESISHRLALGQRAGGDATEQQELGKLTLREGFDLVLDPLRGKYHVETAEWVTQVKAFADTVIRLQLLPPYWVDHKRRDYMELWRRLARSHKEKPEVSGPRHAEMMTAFVISSAKWLVAHEYLPDAYVKLESWRPDMKEVFDAIAPNNAPEAPTPRHSGTELSAIFGVLGDPRLVLYERLLPLIITDQREESLASARRSALNLHAGVATLYLTWTRQRRDKSVLPLSRTVRLSKEARGLLEEALSAGHLQPLEARYLTDGIDYPLFPFALDAVDGVSPPALCASSPNLLELDPRICLAIELGGELRVGQVIECTRRCLSLEATRLAPLGLFRVPGTKIKRGETIVLNARQRAAADHALCTYLSLFEASFDADTATSDYPLFPSGQLSRGVAMPPSLSRGTCKTRTGKTLTSDGALKQFRVLEAVVGVESEKGRGWYGIRRGITDMAPEHTSDPRELDALGGWTPGSLTRRDIYEDSENKKVRAALSAKRDAIRGRGAPQATPPSAVDTANLLALVEQLQPEQKQAMIQALLGDTGV